MVSPTIAPEPTIDAAPTEVDARRVAALLAGATAVVVTVLAVVRNVRDGNLAFFSTGDSRLFLLTARDLFGTGHGFAALGYANEIPYRYGRIGLPFAGWLLGLGRPAFVGWSIIVVYLVAYSAVPALTALLIAEYGGAPAFACAVFVLPSFLVVYGIAFSDPPVLALILLAYLLDARSHPRSALAVLAYAILVKEIALLALVPFVLRAVRRRDRPRALVTVVPAVPYALWCCWVRWRIGEFPFLASTRSRRGAFGAPFAGIHDTLVHRPHDFALLLAITAVTIVAGGTGAWVARATPLGPLAAAYTLLTICLGPTAFEYYGEGLRVLLVPQVVALVAVAVGRRGRREPEPARQRARVVAGRT